MRSPAGNLLAAYGGARLEIAASTPDTRESQPRAGANRPPPRPHGVAYAFPVSLETALAVPDTSLIAWSGGVACGDSTNAVLLPRLRFAPLPLEGGLHRDHLPDLNRSLRLPPAIVTSSLRRHTTSACDWIGAYESWIAATQPGWRDRCIEVWNDIERTAQHLAAGEGVTYEPVVAVPVMALAASWRRLARACAP